MSVPLSNSAVCRRSTLACVVTVLLVGALALSGCVAALIGAGAAGGYAVSKDERDAREMSSDAVITMKVKAKLLADSKVRGLNIDVDTNLGNVTLNGVAKSQEEIDRAVAITKTVAGVKLVKSNLQLREEGAEDDG